MARRRIIAVCCNDGFGSQYLKKMYGFAFCSYMRRHNYRYFHSPIKIGKAGSMHGITREYQQELNKFIGWSQTTGCRPNLILDKIPKAFRIGDLLFTDKIRDQIRAKYYSSEKNNSNRPDNVIHIRRNDVNPRGRTRSGRIRFISNDIYITAIKTILSNYDGRITIHSDSRKPLDKIFSTFLSASEFEMLDFKICDDLKNAFHDMVSAKRLFMAKSSLSYMAGILNENEVFFPNYGLTDGQTSRPLDGWKIWEVSSGT